MSDGIYGQHGWMCPQCGKAHAPSVVTCPEQPMFGTVLTNTTDCGCPREHENHSCASTACPRKLLKGIAP